MKPSAAQNQPPSTYGYNTSAQYGYGSAPTSPQQPYNGQQPPPQQYASYTNSNSAYNAQQQQTYQQYPPQPGTYGIPTGAVVGQQPYSPTQKQQPQQQQPQQQQGGMYAGAPMVGGGIVPGVPLYGSGGSDNGDANQSAAAKKFVIQGYKDVWAALLFVACVLVCFVLGCYNFNDSFKNDMEHHSSSPSAAPDSKPTTQNVNISGGTLVGALFAIVALSAVFAALCLALFHRFPKQAIIAANVASAALMLLAAALALVAGSAIAGALMLLFAVLNCVMLYLWRSRIPFSAILLKVASAITIQYKGLIVSNFALIGVFTFFTIFWSSMMYPAVYRLNNKDQRNGGGDAATVLFGLFAYFWASQVAFNVMHVTTAGVAATWYFVGGSNSGAMPRNPTLSSLKRATTTSFGSICFGSLLVAILRLLRTLARSQREHSEHPFLACILECIIGCVERLVEYFNVYAFVYVAIYGYDYITAAKKTFALASNCAFAALFNDSLVGTTIAMTSMAVSAIALIIFGAAFNNLAIGIVAFFVCLFVHLQVFRVIDSAVTTIFVCFAEEPNALAQANPELFQAIHNANYGGAAAVQQQV